MTKPTWWRRGAIVGAAFGALALSACGEDKQSSDSGSSSASTTKSDVPAGVADASALLAKVKKGTSVEPDATARPAAKGKTIVLVSNGQNNASSALSIKGDMDACKA